MRPFIQQLDHSTPLGDETQSLQFLELANISKF